jgi:DNA polymerase elongation subunit (family B)
MQRIRSKHYFVVDKIEFLTGATEVVTLQGEHPLRYLGLYESYASYKQGLRTARERARELHGEQAYDHLWARNPVESFLIRSSISLFDSMTPECLKVAALDLETYSSKDKFFSDAKDQEDRIIIATIADNRGQSFILSGHELSETELIKALCDRIIEEDYDVICGHNITGFDLPYLMERAGRLGIPLTLGRDLSTLQQENRTRRRNQSGINYHIFGRHIVDTLPLLVTWDFTSRSLSNYGLKTAVFELGLSDRDRNDFDRSAISRLWDQSPESLFAYARDDARDSLALYEFLCPPDFYLTKLLPLNYEQCVTTGTGTKVDLAMQRGYLQRTHSLPLRGALSDGEGTGGLTEARSLGWHREVLKADVASLYPSICLTYGIKPRTDNLDLFLQLLEYLTNHRLKAKQELKNLSPGTLEYRSADALQNSFKILINSFYGMLGAGGLFFSDAEAGAQITSQGQAILLKMVANIESHGGLVIEIDTDGVYFTLPGREFSAQELVALVGYDLPPGIRVEYDGHFDFMYSYAPKNYLLVKDGVATKKGVVFRSRRLYGLQEAFIDAVLNLLCESDSQGISRYYQDLRKRITAGALTLDEVVTTQTVEKPWDEYSAVREKGNRNKALDMVFQRADREKWPPRSKIQYYHSSAAVDGVKMAQDFAQDADQSYYLDVVQKTAEKFIYAFPPEQWAQVFGDYPLSKAFQPWNFRPQASPAILEDYRRVLRGDNQIRLF